MINLDKEEFKNDFKSKMYSLYAQPIEGATNEQLFTTLSCVIKDYISKDWAEANINKETGKQVYYFCIEFLLGRQLSSNLLNLGIKNTVKEAVEELGLNFEEIKVSEVDPALGNGGLGRLAACFLDSMASLGIKGHGCGIRYKYGLFEQKFVNGYQMEMPEYWLKEGYYPWEVRRPNKSIIVKFGGDIELINEDNKLKAIHKNYIPVMAIPYDIPIIGYENETINTLRLWSAEIPREDFDLSLKDAKKMSGSYQKALQHKYDIEAISQVLYPDDSNHEGRLLRLKQEYFLVSAGVQSIVRKFKVSKLSFKEFPQKIGIHINDTHPSLCVPELMRILIDEEGLGWDEAWDITRNTISYTNHTIMAEAMEKWPVDMFKNILPRMYMIIEEINRRHCMELLGKYYNQQEKVNNMAVISHDYINMANLSILGSYSVNGVAGLHTELLKKQVLSNFYYYTPDKFNNKTNGIAHRRWLMLSNPRLSNLITELIGESWKTNTLELKSLRKYENDKTVIQEIEKIKQQNKMDLAKLIYNKNNIIINEESIFDVQVKRLHGYKRQLLNSLHILHLYHQILENPNIQMQPRTFIFGAKAAPGYHFAKSVIKFINSLAEKINNDPIARNKLKVVFIENYGVSLAEKIIPAANVSQQISTTTKEASGTSNMKFMMNGAITLATMDGANIEIYEQVGNENIVVFGLSSEQVLDYYKHGGYSSTDVYISDNNVKKAIDDLINGFIPSIGIEGKEIYDSLITYNDEFFVLRDFDDYRLAQQNIGDLYQDKHKWNQMALINIAESGIFSTDRTIQEYADDIWYKNISNFGVTT